MIPTGHRGVPGGRRSDRAISPALGFAVALLVTVVLAVAVGVLVGAIAEDPEPDADFEWTQNGQGADLEVTLEHAGGDSIPGDRLTLDASGIRGLSGNTSLEDWGTVRNGSTLTVGFVADADVEARQPYRSDTDLEGRTINGTDTETGVDVIAIAVEGRPLQNGTVLVSSMTESEDDVGDTPPADLRTLRLVWTGSWGETELDEYVIE
ncbi:type IV pilin [Halovivax cerinus]|uniref:Type IV pilin n=1 Tax=Halovivax cerinus TaxID=1487865 RepID=A0ABD5NNP5_9EURY|nr:type IV pilin [Halovivax cerinus]